jgi:hypothetical protein
VVEDAELGQTCWSGVVKEGDAAACVFARLGVRHGLVHEVETVVRRPTERLYAPQNMLTPRAMIPDVLDPAARSPREELVRIANAYFDGLEQVNGDLFPAEPGCIRLENGQQTVLVEDLSPYAGTPAELIFPMAMQQQISSGYFAYIDTVRDRRVAAVDESRGLVILIVVFDHTAGMKTVQVKGIGEVEVASYHQRPNSVLIAELFKVRSGRIAHVEAILEFTPFGTRTGWEA